MLALKRHCQFQTLAIHASTHSKLDHPLNIYAERKA